MVLLGLIFSKKDPPKIAGVYSRPGKIKLHHFMKYDIKLTVLIVFLTPRKTVLVEGRRVLLTYQVKKGNQFACLKLSLPKLGNY